MTRLRSKKDGHFDLLCDIGELADLLEVIDDFAAEADFFAIGTNDFIRYMPAETSLSTLEK